VAAASGVPTLHGQLAALDPAAARRLHPNDRVRIIRAIEKHGSGASDGRAGWARTVSPWQVLLIGLCQERGALNRRLEERARGMFSVG
jgi:tRNA dimethylallyltransferase